jgi:hypothetical protein
MPVLFWEFLGVLAAIILLAFVVLALKGKSPPPRH